jgi:hypothetical protein
MKLVCMVVNVTVCVCVLLDKFFSILSTGVPIFPKYANVQYIYLFALVLPT